MPTPHPALLDPARYPFRCNIETRFADIDVNQHINNVSLIGLLEEARVRFHRASGFHAAMTGITAMVASLTVEFLAESRFPSPLDMHVAPSRLGNTSYMLNQLVVQDGRVAAYAEAVMVCVGPDGPVPLPALFRENAPAWMLTA